MIPALVVFVMALGMAFQVLYHGVVAQRLKQQIQEGKDREGLMAFVIESNEREIRNLKKSTIKRER